VIPRLLFRTVPEVTSDKVEAWWVDAKLLHPQWQHVTVREPVDPAQFPISSHLWPTIEHGAQKAGLIRLELIYTFGGVYIDSDVQVCRSFETLRCCELFAGWEDKNVIPDAVFGAERANPVVGEMLEIAMCYVELGQDPWSSGPGVFTDVLQTCNRAVLFPPGTLYPVHYRQKHLLHQDNCSNPWTHTVHHWAGSWVSPGRE